MTAEIVAFPRAVTPATREFVRSIIEEEITPQARRRPDEPPAMTTTAKNERLRSSRREVWRKAEALTNYWHMLLRFTDTVERARREGVKEALAHPKVSMEERWPILDSYRDALGKQLLTPAPDLASIEWKRRHSKKMTSLNVTRERVQKAIADDIAFLDAHPTRNSPSSRRKGEA